jgi:hypothetical protein
MYYFHSSQFHIINNIVPNLLCEQDTSATYRSVLKLWDKVSSKYKQLLHNIKHQNDGCMKYILHISCTLMTIHNVPLHMGIKIWNGIKYGSME